MPPVTERLIELPAQTVGLAGEITRTAGGIKVGLMVCVFLQPNALTALTEYPPDIVGVTTIELALLPPGVQVKTPTAAGETADKVVVLPGQVSAGFAVKVMLGPGSTVIVITAAAVQAPDAPIAVYVVVTLGVKLWKMPVTLSGIQVKLGAPSPIKDTSVPGQIIATVAGKIETGKGAELVIVVTKLLVHPAREVAIVL